MTLLASHVDGATITLSFAFYDAGGNVINATGGSGTCVLKARDGTTTTKSLVLDADPTTVPQASVTFQAADYSSIDAPTELYGKTTLTVGTTVYTEDEFVVPLTEDQFPGANGAIATYSQARQFFGTDAERSTVEFLLRASTRFIERATGREFISATRTEDYDGKGSEHIYLKGYPITSITSVSTVASDGTLSAFDTTSYRFDADMGRLTRLYAHDTLGGHTHGTWGDGWGYRDFPGRGVTRANVWPWGVGNIRVVYVGGYTAATMPDDLVMHCIDIAKDFFDQRGQSGTISSESIGDYSYTRLTGDEVRQRHQRLVSHYRDWGVAL